MAWVLLTRLRVSKGWGLPSGGEEEREEGGGACQAPHLPKSQVPSQAGTSCRVGGDQQGRGSRGQERGLSAPYWVGGDGSLEVKVSKPLAT